MLGSWKAWGLLRKRGGFPGGSVGKKSSCNTGGPGSIPGLGRSPGEGNSNPLQYSGLENSMDRGAWWAVVYGVTRIGHDLVTKSPPPGSALLVPSWLTFSFLPALCSMIISKIICWRERGQVWLGLELGKAPDTPRLCSAHIISRRSPCEWSPGVVLVLRLGREQEVGLPTPPVICFSFSKTTFHINGVIQQVFFFV